MNFNGTFMFGGFVPVTLVIIWNEKKTMNESNLSELNQRCEFYEKKMNLQRFLWRYYNWQEMIRIDENFHDAFDLVLYKQTACNVNWRKKTATITTRHQRYAHLRQAIQFIECFPVHRSTCSNEFECVIRLTDIKRWKWQFPRQRIFLK